jgi:hypothetical protein
VPQARAELLAVGVQLGEAIQVEVAQVEDQQAAGLGLDLGDGALDIAGATGLDVQLDQSAGLEVPENLEFHGGAAGVIAAATAWAEVCQLVGQVDGGGIADQDGGELLEQRRKRRLCGDGLLESALAGLAAEVDQGLTGGKAFLDGGLSNLQAEPGGGEGEIGPGGIGLVQERDDPQEQQRATGEGPLPKDHLAVASELVEFLSQIFLQRGGNSP